MATPIHIYLLTPAQLNALAHIGSSGGATAAAQRLRQLLRRAGGRALGWRGRPPRPEIRAALRAAGIVLAWVGAADRLPLAAVADVAQEGPLLAVLEADAAGASPRIWLAQLATLRLPTLRVALFRVPRCAVDGVRGDLEVTLSEAQAPRPADPGCDPCGLAERCAGPLAKTAVRPLPRPISNQFDLVEWSPEASDLSLGEAAERQPFAVDAASVARTVTLRTPAGDRHFRCDNTGWSSARLDTALQRTGQAWLDVSDKARLDDFAADLRALVCSAAAEPLPSGAWRPSVWHAVEDDLFAVEEAALAAHIGGLRGLVVDIGAGPIRYLRTLAARISSGDVRYFAVEPDLTALRRTAVALPGAMLSQGVGERLPLRAASADHLLMLRSFNHLRDVTAAFAEATRVARPGASLLVVDNVAFGLLRTQKQVDRARAISVVETPFEHYRNANADAAVAAIDATASWSIAEVRAVTPGRANQWLVRATRR